MYAFVDGKKYEHDEIAACSESRNSYVYQEKKIKIWKYLGTGYWDMTNKKILHFWKKL